MANKSGLKDGLAAILDVKADKYNGLRKKARDQLKMLEEKGLI